MSRSSAEAAIAPVVTLVVAMVFGAALFIGLEGLVIVGAIALVVAVLVAWRPLAALYIAVGIIPLEAAGRVVSGVPELTWAKVFMVATTASFLVSSAMRREHLTLPRRAWMILGWWLVGVVASMFSPWAGGSTILIPVALAGQIGLLLLVFWLIRTESQLRGLLWAIVIGSILVAAVGVLDVALGRSVLGSVDRQFYASTVTSTLRVTSTFYDPNALGRYLAFAICVTIGLGLSPSTSGWLRGLLSLLVLAQGFVLVNTFSRGAMAALAGGLLTLMVLGLRGRNPVPKLFVGAAFLGVGGWLIRDDLLLLVNRVFLGAGGRFELAAIGLSAFAERPLVGWGFGFVASAMRLFAGEAAATHNLYIEVLVSSGVIGMVLWVTFFGGTVWQTRGFAKGHDRGITAALFSAVVALAVMGLTLHGIRSNEMWVCAGALLAAGRLAEVGVSPGSEVG